LQIPQSVLTDSCAIEHSDLSGNRIKSVAKLLLPESVRTLNLSSCSLTSLRGLQLPWDLEQLDLTANTLSEIEIREADVEVLHRIKSKLPAMPDQTCTSPNATLTAINNSTTFVCVIPDKVFNALYTPTPAPPTSHPFVQSSASLTQQQLTSIVLAGGGVALVIILYIGYRAFRGDFDYTASMRRSRRRRRSIQRDDNNLDSSDADFVSSETGERSLGFPTEYFEDDDVRFDKNLVQFRISKSEIHKKKVLARGGFGVVYLARYRGLTVAVKQLQRERMRYRTITLFMKEIRLLASLQHPHIVGFLGLAWSTLHDLAIVLEYLPRGDLYTFLRHQRKEVARSPATRSDFTWFQSSSPNKNLTVPTKSAIAMDIADALAYMHGQERPIIHRDLKSRNVLLSSDLRAKVTDFGISRLQTVEETMTREVGTIAWIAPEVLKGGRYSEKADIYSLGVLLTELDTCQTPYKTGFGANAPKRNNTWIASMVSAGAIQPALLESCPIEVRELTHKCLSFDASSRPSAVQVLQSLQSMANRERQ
jgi:hypothetical protein